METGWGGPAPARALQPGCERRLVNKIKISESLEADTRRKAERARPGRLFSHRGGVNATADEAGQGAGAPTPPRAPNPAGAGALQEENSLFSSLFGPKPCNDLTDDDNVFAAQQLRVRWVFLARRPGLVAAPGCAAAMDAARAWSMRGLESPPR